MALVLSEMTNQGLLELVRDLHRTLNSACFGAGDCRNYAAASQELLRRGFVASGTYKNPKLRKAT